MQKKITTIIFDLGGVLIDWNPEYVYLKEFRGDRAKMDRFLNNICAWDWNANQDAGYPIATATEERVTLFPEYEELIRMYYGRWEEMLGFAHQDTLAILKDLVENPNYRILALTNWSAETWPKAIAKFTWLKWFDGILVSGQENIRKPFPEIYELLISRYDINKDEALFIDDSVDNIEGGEGVGIKGIHFKNAQKLVQQLGDLGIEL
jgi:2-haloacid dehalogenase